MGQDFADIQFTPSATDKTTWLDVVCSDLGAVNSASCS